MKNEEFDDLMRQFRAACVQTAQREYAASQRSRWERERAVRRWMVPVFASALVAAASGITAVTVYHRQPAPKQAQVNAPQANQPAVSDEALLSAVDEDLSNRVPQALAPLAVSYTSNPSARGQNQKE